MVGCLFSWRPGPGIRNAAATSFPCLTPQPLRQFAHSLHCRHIYNPIAYFRIGLFPVFRSHLIITSLDLRSIFTLLLVESPFFMFQVLKPECSCGHCSSPASLSQAASAPARWRPHSKSAVNTSYQCSKEVIIRFQCNCQKGSSFWPKVCGN